MNKQVKKNKKQTCLFASDAAKSFKKQNKKNR